MVFLHAAAAGRDLGRTSGDLDVLVDVRAVGNTARGLAACLVELGFAPEISVDGRAHRFRRGPDVVDLLLPEGLGTRTALETVAGARTLSVPGGSQALRRTQRGPVEVVGVGTGVLPRPDLLGAVLLKGRAVEVGGNPAKHLRDLAFLLTLVADPAALRGELQPRERHHLRARAELLDPRHPAYRGLPFAEDGAIALAMLIGS